MKGWFRESYRHSLASRGIPTRRYMAITEIRLSKAPLKEDKGTIAFQRVVSPGVMTISRDWKNIHERLNRKYPLDQDSPEESIMSTISHEEMHDILSNWEATGEVPLGTSERYHALNESALYDYDDDSPVIEQSNFFRKLEPYGDDLSPRELKAVKKRMESYGVSNLISQYFPDPDDDPTGSVHAGALARRREILLKGEKK